MLSDSVRLLPFTRLVLIVSAAIPRTVGRARHAGDHALRYGSSLPYNLRQDLQD